MRFVASAGKAVPWSGEERAGEITKLYAMCRRFGPPSGFLTVAPDDVHQAKTILLSYRAGRPDAFPSCADHLLPVLRGEASPQRWTISVPSRSAPRPTRLTNSASKSTSCNASPP